MEFQRERNNYLSAVLIFLRVVVNGVGIMGGFHEAVA
jgi:hypothetical protein